MNTVEHTKGLFHDDLSSTIGKAKDIYSNVKNTISRYQGKDKAKDFSF